MPPPYRIIRHPAPKRPRRSGLLLLCLGAVLAAALLLYGQAVLRTPPPDPQAEARQSLERLNQIRRQSGVSGLAYSSKLAQSAQSHADYLSLDPQDAHEEYNPANPYFSGETLGERTEKAGYDADSAENLITTNYPISGSEAAEELMTALYHRLSLLNPAYDEAGAGWARRGHTAVVFNQGSSREREQCARIDEAQARSAAHPQNEDHCDGTPAPALPEYVPYPVGGGIEPAYAGDETPNPMPGYAATGNPVSIAFYGGGDIEAVSFKLFAGAQEVRPAHLMYHANDPNALMDANEFALFPLEPLRHDTDYRAEFRYRRDGGAIQTASWQFRTRAKRSWLE